MADPHSTLYPKITNHIRDVVRYLHRIDATDGDATTFPGADLPPIPIIGTVKLHGTHGDILIHNDSRILFQSRNIANLLTSADNSGFATAMSTRQKSLLRLRDQYLKRWKELNPDQDLDINLPVTIAGEWIGQGIQKGVAITKLSKRLVIISAKINGKWIPDTDYGDIEAPEDSIYNISRGGVYHSTLYPQDQKRTIDELEVLADKIAARCPFAESFGVIGEGEGLVWKPVPYIHDSNLWFKTKGGRFKPTFMPAPKKPAGDMLENKQVTEAAALLWCSEHRLDQGWDLLQEMGLPRNISGIKDFLRWVQQDILIEEKSYIEEQKIDDKILKGEIIRIARPWYMKKLQSSES